VLGSDRWRSLSEPSRTLCSGQKEREERRGEGAWYVHTSGRKRTLILFCISRQESSLLGVEYINSRLCHPLIVTLSHYLSLIVTLSHNHSLIQSPSHSNYLPSLTHSLSVCLSLLSSPSPFPLSFTLSLTYRISHIDPCVYPAHNITQYTTITLYSTVQYSAV
jgi:hypothetical protein